MVNDGGEGIWRFYVDGESTPFDYSPTMIFNLGWIATNSERYNTCDSLWANIFNLNFYTFTNWTSSYDDLECFYTSAPDWYFNKISNSQNEVTQSPGVTCP